MKEYTENGSPLGQYYTANDSIVARKMFDLHGLNGRDAGVKTTGGMMYYNYDGLRNVSELTDRNGGLIEQYRYDAFGSLYTGVTAPYNTTGFAGRTYDPKAGFVDMNARWYAPQTGRFTSADSYRGSLLTPYTQNRYAYVGNNPINRWDPTGYWEDELVDSYYWTAWEELDYWTEWDYSSSTSKGSNGWYTSWTDTKTEYWLYAEHWFETEVYSSGVEIDYYLGYDLWLFWDETVYSGTNFTSFTAREWYEENKDNLMQHGPPPADFINNFNRPLGEVNVWKYSSSDPSSGTDILLNKTSSAPDNVTGAKTKLLQEHLNKALGETPGYTEQTTDGWYKKTGRVIENFQERYESLQTTVSKGAWDYVFNPALKFLTAPLNAVYTGAKYAGQAENPLMAIPKGLEGTFYGLLGGLANVPPPNLQMNYPKEWITGSVTEALSANDKKANDYFDKHPVIKAGVDLVSDFGIGLLMGAAVRSIVNTITNPAPKVTYVKETPKTWTSTDKYVGETANAIEAKYPGKVVEVNKIKYRPDGTILTDFDIELNNTVIQVKAGTAKGLTSQITKTATGTFKEVIGYAPDLNPSSALVKNASKQGINVFTSLEDLLNYFNK